jgi:hypothetical protein
VIHENEIRNGLIDRITILVYGILSIGPDLLHTMLAQGEQHVDDGGKEKDQYEVNSFTHAFNKKGL